VALFVVSFLPATSFVGGSAASTPAYTAAPAYGGTPAKVATQSVTPSTGKYGPHPGTLEIWEATGGGPSEADPSVCYYTVCDEPISNVYQTLIAYNGTQDGPTAASYVPQLATCVPGSLECAAQFGGNDLVYDNNTTGAPQYYTFEIDSGARFYDAAHSAAWAVYPSDVLFTFARTMGFADLPYEEATNGWINTQELVGAGNRSWDGGIHAPLNNTPQSILNAFLVNNSYYCPTSPVVTTNGCITFNVGASGQSWPYFLELVADNLGGSIQSCGWDTANGGAVPGFAGTNASNGDGPCLLPGSSTSTQQPGFLNYVSSTPATGWDTFEELALNLPAVQPGIQWSEVGSGPYYVENPINPDVGYTLHANPAYAAPVGCAGTPGCMPLPGTYAANADIVWEASGDTAGLNEMNAGQADSAGFFSTDTSVVLGYTNYKLISGIPSLSIFFEPLDLNFNVTNYGTQAAPSSINVPNTFFQNVALRNFLVNAFPYTSVDQTYNCPTPPGICFGEDYGGAIPHNMGDYYPTNITWPSGNPAPNASQPGNVAWWWAQANDASSPYYDPQLAGCTPSTPCYWDDFGIIGDPVLDGEYSLWNTEISTLTNGTLTPAVQDITGQTLITDLGSPAGTSPLTIYSLGWAPDYPDPTDYVAPLYYPDNSYSAPDALSETLQAAPNNDSTCPNDYGAWSNLTYYANIGELPTGCQGGAYDTMVAWMNLAAHEPNVAYRTLEYNLIEHIAALLGLYVYNPQSLVAVDYGNWIQGSTINLSPIYGGGGVQLWYDWGYAANYFTATFNEAGLGNNPAWTATLGGTTLSSQNTTSVAFSNLINGTYPWSIPSVPGYLASPSSGNAVISGGNFTQLVNFAQITGKTYEVGFTESGLRAGTTWSVIVSGTGGGVSLSGNTTTLWTNLTNGTWNYVPRPVTGYATPATGNFTIAGAPQTVTIAYAGVVYHSYAVTFTETGLASGASWTITVNGWKNSSSSPTITVYLGNGTYSWGIFSLPSGYSASPTAGTIAVTGASVNVAVTATANQQQTVNTSPAWTYLSTLAWVLIGVLALLVIIFLALAMMAGRRPPSSPPESWSSSSSSTTESKDNKGGSA
jgi:hypothetical protein